VNASELALAFHPAVARWPDLRLVVVFGSVATGKARPDSDVDVGVLGGSFWDQLAAGNEVTLQPLAATGGGFSR
jgi:predicted nucleotidyltransferase